MAEFMIRFFIGNILISCIIGILLITKRLLRNNLTSRMHYNSAAYTIGGSFYPFPNDRFSSVFFMDQ